VTRRRLLAAAAALVLAVVVVVVVATTGDQGGGRGGDGDAVVATTGTVAPGDAPFCDAFGALLGGPLADVATDASDPDVLASGVEDTRALLAQLVASSPAEVSASAVALAEQYEAAFAIFERYGYDLARVDTEATPEETALLDAFGQAPVGPLAVDPFEAIETFVADRCAPGITVPPELLTTVPPATNP
jgi:hypothetical protein